MRSYSRHWMRVAVLSDTHFGDPLSTLVSAGAREGEPTIGPAYTPLAPFNVIAVELDEDPSLRLIGNLVESASGEINEVDPHSIKIGEPVRVVFSRVDDVHLPRWVRA